MSGLAPATTIFRSNFWRGFAVLWVGFVIVIVWDIVAKDAVSDSYTWFAWIGLLSALVWCTSWRPLVKYDLERVEVRNPLRTAKLPWNAVTRIDATDALRVHTDDRIMRAWAVSRSGAVATLVRNARSPGPGGQTGPEKAALAALARRSPIDYAVEVIREMWEQQRKTANGQVEVTWAVPEIIVIVVLAAVVVVASVV